MKVIQENQQNVQIGGAIRRIRFVPEVKDGDTAWMSFKHPATMYAVLFPARGTEAQPLAQNNSPDRPNDALDVSIFPWGEAQQSFEEWVKASSESDGMLPIYVKSRGVELWWRPGQAVLQCDPGPAESLLAAVVEFSYYERALRRIEAEVEAAWGELEEDKPLAYDVAPADLRRGDITGGRVARAFQRRIDYARMEPHLYAPDPLLPAAARKLGEELRERADFETRAETLDGGLEVFEHIYELVSQRIGEYKAARQGHHMELIIIWLLVAEALLMLTQMLLHR